ncbi:4-hydroxy-tetrahydrodipicolinate synthase [Psychroflexus planctonicus]|uniref:4-hydroxy-tetrahydrodipicolinate synthase n=1 Tax=Psychroflexus planctonicus TaxID=1526575 RepID=A0ABQ1SG11_9FLAO|nr:4-hydroxy-tetrahydrodipicolinate synthase [Psychroflexus planctonicus]GGE30617.1 4-hydroxy-tetrahydrodipicolinate synthase [Psychroflexus planctonicus]
MEQFKGTGVALITPFKEDKSLDLEALENLVEYQIENGIDYIVVLGTTAESATLTQEEKSLVKQTIVWQNKGRLPLVLGMGSNNTKALVDEIEATDFTGFDAILSVSPYYNKPTQAGIYAHFAEVAKASKIPIILYNVPGRTASNMEVETVAKLAKDFDNIIGIKEAKGDLVQAMDLIAATPDDFLVISGDDMITLPMVLAGGAGVISVIAEGFPKEFSQMVNLGLERKVDEAYQLHYKIAPAINIIFEQGNPAGIKAVFAHKDLCKNELRLPLLPVDESLNNRLLDLVNRLK